MITRIDDEQRTGGKRALVAGAVVLVCAPMVLTLLLLLAVEWPKMDAVTQHMPRAVRSTVASGILSVRDEGASPAQMQRAKRLDAETVARYGLRMRQVLAMGNVRNVHMEKPLNMQAAEALGRQAIAEQRAGNACAAQRLYADAAEKYRSYGVYRYVEGSSRAALACGDLPAARTGLESAIQTETNFLKGTDEDQLVDVRADLLKDREFLTVVYRRQHEDALAAGVCSEAHKSWKGCVCVLGKEGDVKCTERL